MKWYLVVTGMLFNFICYGFSLSGEETASPLRQSLSFEDRVVCQRSIENVYWRHTIWPPENSQPKPGLDAMITEDQIRLKVQSYLRKSRALEERWHSPITAQLIQAEVDRIMRETRNPAILSEMIDALHRDPYLVAECLARPIVVDRMSLTKGSELWWAQNIGRFEMLHRTPTVHYRLSEMQAGKVFSPEMLQGATSNSWAKTTTTGAPSARRLQTAVYTGNQVIIWGGENGIMVNTGAYYNAVTNSWFPTSTIGAPSARISHTAIWTGAEMIVWGGDSAISSYTKSGGRFNPSTNTWKSTAAGNKAPSARVGHSAVWTGKEMVIWGGISTSAIGLTNSGARYNPSKNSWTPMLTNAFAIPTPRLNHAAFWTGSRMLIWGGSNGINPTNTGGLYNPSSDSWTSTNTTDAPAERDGFTAVWTGSQMLIWGGMGIDDAFRQSGKRYEPSTDSWISMTTTGAPSARGFHSAVWSGTEMIVWGGKEPDLIFTKTGGRYNPSTNSWKGMTISGAPSTRDECTALWAGNVMVIWGGYSTNNSAVLKSGSRYTP